MPKIAFLGAGNMASAIIDGLLAKGVAPTDLACIGGPDRTAELLSARTGVRAAATLDELLAGSDAVIAAFKPQQLAEVDPSIAELTSGRLVISIIAGKRLERLAGTFTRARNIVRCMPNTPARIGAGITAWCALRELAPGDRAALDLLLGAMGQAVEVPEAQMDAVTALSGSGPAYVFEFAAALRDAGISAGLAPAAAEKLAVQTLLGAARLLSHLGSPPEKLRDEVTSPKGTTFAGLQRLSAGDFRGLIRAAVLAAQARSEELSRD